MQCGECSQERRTAGRSARGRFTQGTIGCGRFDQALARGARQRTGDGTPSAARSAAQGPAQRAGCAAGRALPCRGLQIRRQDELAPARQGQQRGHPPRARHVALHGLPDGLWDVEHAPTPYLLSLTDLNAFLPEQLVRALLRGLPVMDRRFQGRFLRDATLTGPEARGSSPVRVIRDPITRQSPAVAGLYPCGEGAGFAGGIVSAAVDGLRTARAVAATFAPSR